MSREGYTPEGDARLREFLCAKTGDRGLALTRLNEVCISRIYRATRTTGSALFVKWGLVPTSLAADFLAFADGCPLVPHLVGGCPFVLDGKPVFCFDWIDLRRLRIDQMSDAQFASFLSAYDGLFRLMQDFGRAGPPADGDVWMASVRTYAHAHPAGKALLRRLVEIPPEHYRHGESAARFVTHGDLHSGNFSFTGDRLTTFLDFDNFAWGSPVDDLAFAFAESAKRSETAYSPAKRRRLRERLAAAARRMRRPLSEWRVAFSVIRLNLAAKTLIRHPTGLRVALQVAARDRRLRRFAETLNVEREQGVPDT